MASCGTRLGCADERQFVHIDAPRWGRVTRWHADDPRHQGPDREFPLEFVAVAARREHNRSGKDLTEGLPPAGASSRIHGDSSGGIWRSNGRRLNGPRWRRRGANENSPRSFGAATRLCGTQTRSSKTTDIGTHHGLTDEKTVEQRMVAAALEVRC